MPRLEDSNKSVMWSLCLGWPGSFSTLGLLVGVRLEEPGDAFAEVLGHGDGADEDPADSPPAADAGAGSAFTSP